MFFPNFTDVKLQVQEIMSDSTNNVVFKSQYSGRDRTSVCIPESLVIYELWERN